MRILWVENHLIFAHVAGRQFLASHEVLIVPTIAEARKVLKTEMFDVVLLDYDLDDGKGTELVKEIKQFQNVALIAVSSHTEGNNLLKSAGADHSCTKLHFHEIAKVISSVT
ncbi:MAG: response regulator [Zavarzinella sp.]